MQPSIFQPFTKANPGSHYRNKLARSGHTHTAKRGRGERKSGKENREEYRYAISHPFVARNGRTLNLMPGVTQIL